MNAEIRMGSSLGFERERRHAEYNNRFSQMRPMVGVSLKPHLTPREIDLMRELVRGDGGDQNKEIGFRLGITEATVKVYMHYLQKRLNLNSRTALALYVERSGMFYECAGELPSLEVLAIPSVAASLAFESIDGSGTVQPQTVRWRDSRSICCLVDAERHLGHIVRAGNYWLAFDATHLNERRTGFCPLGFSMNIAAAKRAVELAIAREWDHISRLQ
jgi:DNA-binding CsgD family transcriptional regulator